MFLRDESWDASALFWEAPSLSFGESCKSAGQVSSKGQGSEPSLHFHTRLGEPICWKSLREYLLQGGRGGKLRA